MPINPTPRPERPAPRRLNGQYLCMAPGCNNACHSEWVYCITHFNDVINHDGTYVPAMSEYLDGSQVLPRLPTPPDLSNVANRRDASGNFLCLWEGCHSVIARRYIYCRNHTQQFCRENDVMEPPRLGEPIPPKPVLISQYGWASHIMNMGSIIAEYDGEPEDLRAMLAFTGGYLPGVGVDIQRSLQKQTFKKRNGKIRGPLSIYSAIIADGKLPKAFDDGGKVPKRFHRELRDALASGVTLPVSVAPVGPTMPVSAPIDSSFEHVSDGTWRTILREPLTYRGPSSIDLAASLQAMQVGNNIRFDAQTSWHSGWTSSHFVTYDNAEQILGASDDET